jgi:hypothetical protein
MKINFVKITMTFSAFLVICLISSCLKDKDFDKGATGAIASNGQPNIIEIGVNLTSSRNDLVESFDVSSSDTTLALIPVSLSSGGPATQDIHVTLKLDSSLINEYNYKDTGADGKGPVYAYALPDKSVYTILNAGNVVTIPKGSYTGYLSVKLKTINYLSGLQAFDFAIASVDPAVGYTISGNLNRGIVIVGAKNKYDGVYELIGHHNRPTLDFQYDVTESMKTAGPTSVAFYWDDAGSFGHPIGDGVGSTSWYGKTMAPVVVFDPITNLVTSIYNGGGTTLITMYTGAGAGVSRYVPATKTMYVYWNYNGNPLRAFFDTLTYIKARP